MKSQNLISLIWYSYVKVTRSCITTQSTLVILRLLFHSHGHTKFPTVCCPILTFQHVVSWHVVRSIVCIYFYANTANASWAGIAQSVKRLATGWTVRGLNSGGGEIFRARPDRPWGPPSLLYNEYRLSPGGKAAGVWRWSPTPSCSEVKERVDYTSTPPLGLRGLL